MCILFIYRNPNADAESYRLIVASNRDEMIKRPALPVHYWEKHPGCLGGTDMEPGREGGAWLALSIKGKAGIILNLVNESGVTETPKRGRGYLIPSYITSNDTPDLYLNKLHEENQRSQPYNPYSLVLLNLHNTDVHYLSSSISSTGPQLCSDNILGFANSGLEFPYKKVEAGKIQFNSIVQNVNASQEDVLIENLLRFLKSEERHLPDPELQRRCPKLYDRLSSIFVSINGYGTRTHSILLVTGADNITFVEETLMPDATWKRNVFHETLTKE